MSGEFDGVGLPEHVQDESGSLGAPPELIGPCDGGAYLDMARVGSDGELGEPVDDGSLVKTVGYRGFLSMRQVFLGYREMGVWVFGEALVVGSGWGVLGDVGVGVTGVEGSASTECQTQPGSLVTDRRTSHSASAAKIEEQEERGSSFEEGLVSRLSQNP